MDLDMPELDGFGATRQIRTLPGPACKVPIIALTASVMASDKERCLEAGMNDHLAKPVDAKSLAEVIHTHVRERRSDPTPTRVLAI